MRKSRWLLILLLGLWIPPSSLLAQETMRWEASLESAKRTASQSNKLVLAVFCAPWCSACRAMEADLLNQPAAMQALQAKFVPVKLNIDYFQATGRQYGVTMLPTTIVIAPTAQGEPLDSIQGRVEIPQYVNRLTQVADDAARRRNGAVAARIAAAQPAGSAAGAQQPIAQQPSVSAGPGAGTRPSDPFVSRPAGWSPPTAAADNRYAMVAPTLGPTPPMTANTPAPIAPAIASNMAPGRPAGPPAGPPTGPQMSNAAAPSQPAGAPPFGLDGFCPVQLMEKGVWSPGNRQWGAIHRGRTYLFAGPDEQRRFLADPDRFAPVSSGEDIVVALEQGRSTAGNRLHGVFYGGRVFLFADEGSLERFSKNPKFYADRALQALQTSTPSGSQVR